MKISIKARAQEIVREKYPHAIEVATGAQVWIQSPNVTISKGYSFSKSGSGATKMAWCDAARHIVDKEVK